MKAESLLAFARQNMEITKDSDAFIVWSERVRKIEETLAVYEWHHWTPPAWIKAGWVAMDMSGVWRWYEHRPTIGITMWINSDGSRSTVCVEGPVCRDWMTSLRQVARGEKTIDREKTAGQIEEEIKHMKAKLAKLYTEKQKRHAMSK